MVNIPPIPPLLSSTPPPIDFGEDDDDLDILPPVLNDVEDGFGCFLVDDGLKTDEPLPSPRSSSCGFSPTSLYDCSIQLEDDGKNDTKTSSLQLTDAKNIIKSKNLTEAFNFNVRNLTDAETNIREKTERHANENENADHVIKETQEEIKVSNNGEMEDNSQDFCTAITVSSDNSVPTKNIKDLKIDPCNDADNCKNDKKQVGCMQNLVSIEDIEDDLSDDELYSPKTPKNFVVNDNLTDFFKIEEIKSLSTSECNLKKDSYTINSKSVESKDNNESASLKNEDHIEFKSLSSDHCIQNQLDTPPPLSDDFKSFDDDLDDDFGDFADFQETHFINNAVPVENINIDQDNIDTVTNKLSSFNKYNKAESVTNLNNTEIEINELGTAEEKDYVKMEEEFKDLALNNSSFTDDQNEHLHKKVVVNEINTQVTTQESTNENDENCKEFNNINAKDETKQPVEQLSHEDNSFNDFNNTVQIDNNQDFGNFAEFSNTPASNENINLQTTEENVDSISNDDDEYNEFADFEAHQDVTKSEVKCHLSLHDDFSEKDEEDDDDFGDFNTAEPIAITTPSSIVTKTSQNIETPVLTTNNLTERISKILQLMFTLNLNPMGDDSDALKANKIQDIPFTSIDAAKALEYQWLNSDTRHSFIRSLGIDSRNILYGDNWNPSLPRFAANLSFNPLKPMKPAQSSSSTGDSSAALDSIPVSSSETKQPIELSSSIKKETLDIDWQSSIVAKQKPAVFKDNSFNAPIGTSLSMACTANRLPTTETESLAFYENTTENEDKFSKTPPISEMESVTTFSTHMPAVTIDINLPTDLEENLKNSLNVNEVVVTSTFAGTFKETHIYTPPMMSDFETKNVIATPSTSSSSPTKSSPIDFDYEKAAMGVIIDETVVKKEYRDVEYNPPFTMESLSKSVSPKMDLFETSSYIHTNLNTISNLADKKENDIDCEDPNDDFSEFQSVSSEVAVPEEPATIPTISKPLELSKATAVSHGGMILSPAILIPQAISMENQRPKIEWGDSTATINPEELARIEELFPEPKSLKSANSSQKSTPTHQIVASAPSISATVASKELEGHINNTNDDDDDWCDFVSVTVTNNISSSRTGSNNNVLAKNPAGSPFQQRSPVLTNKIPSATHINSNNDDEWSEFVSSAPPQQQANAYRVPQFNSGAWQNANFYNNPLSMYHKGPLNIPTTTAATHSAHKYLQNNNNNYSVSHYSHSVANNASTGMMANNMQPHHNSYKQQIHVMQNFSTAPVPTPERLTAAAAAVKNNQFQSIGSAKVAPSIALIPDLGFVAPAIPTHTSFISSLPKPSINMKK